MIGSRDLFGGLETTDEPLVGPAPPDSGSWTPSGPSPGRPRAHDPHASGDDATDAPAPGTSRRPSSGRPGPARLVRRHHRHALLVALASIALPGSGHVVLGAGARAVGLLAVVVLAPVAAVLLRQVLPGVIDELSWLVGRLAVVAAVYAVVDAPMRVLETAARVPRRDRDARLAAALNAATWGGGHLRLGETATGITALVMGLVLQGLLLFLGPDPLRWASELIPLGLAVWAYRSAREIGGTRRGGPEKSVAMPTWLPSTALALSLVWTLAAGLIWSTQSRWLDARRVDRSAAVQVEPYYRNPVYGVEVEMPTPGWTFRSTGPHTLLRAFHPGGETEVELLLRPRVPWWDDPDAALLREFEELEARGLRLDPTGDGTSVWAERTARRVYANAARGSEALGVQILLLEDGHRRWVLRATYERDHADFARPAIDALVRTSRIGDRSTARPTP